MESMLEFKDLESARRVIMLQAAEELRLKNENAYLQAQVAWLKAARLPSRTPEPSLSWRVRFMLWLKC